MGTGYTRNDTVNNIADGNVINASDLDGEFDAVQAAFNESTGHTHDGTSAEGAPVTTVGPAQDVNVGTGAVTPKTDNTIDLGSGSLEFKDLYIDGTANIDSLVADTADINAGTIDGTVIGGATPAAATVTTLTVNGNTTLGDAATDTVTFTADVSSNLIPSADNTHDLGASGSEWKDLYIDGTANIDSLVADTADINAGTIDGVTIGGSSPGVATFTTANATTVDATNIEVTNIKAKDGSAAATIANSTGVITVGSSVLTTTDINGGTIDGTTIGGASAGAGTFTTLTATGNVTLGNAATDTVTITADVASNVIPSADNTYDLGASGSEWKDLYIDGTANIDSLVADTADINGGTIDGTAIGGASAAAGSFTTLNTSGAVVFNDAGANVDFRVEGDTDANLLFVDASTNRVGIGTSSPGALLDVSSDTGSSSPTPTEFRISSSADGSSWSLTDPWAVLGFYSADASGGGAQNLAQISAVMNTATGGTASLDFTLANSGASYAQTSWLKLQNGAGSASRKVVVGAAGGLSVNGDITADGIYLGGTVAANYLDDYEEGTWTPTIRGRPTAGVGTYSQQVGRYTKVGNRVYITGRLIWSAHTGTGTMDLASMPFTSNSASNNRPVINLFCENISLTAGNLATAALIDTNATTAQVFEAPTGGGSGSAVNIDTAGQITFSGFYEV
jgi:hypothetical protein